MTSTRVAATIQHTSDPGTLEPLYLKQNRSRINLPASGVVLPKHGDPAAWYQRPASVLWRFVLEV